MVFKHHYSITLKQKTTRPYKWSKRINIPEDNLKFDLWLRIPILVLSEFHSIPSSFLLLAPSYILVHYCPFVRLVVLISNSGTTNVNAWVQENANIEFLVECSHSFAKYLFDYHCLPIKRINVFSFVKQVSLNFTVFRYLLLCLSTRDAIHVSVQCYTSNYYFLFVCNKM